MNKLNMIRSDDIILDDVMKFENQHKTTSEFFFKKNNKMLNNFCRRVVNKIVNKIMRKGFNH